MVCQRGACLFEVGSQRVFLGTLFFKLALPLHVSPGSLKIRYTDYPAQRADQPDYYQGENLDNVFPVRGISRVNIFHQYPPQQYANGHAGKN